MQNQFILSIHLAVLGCMLPGPSLLGADRPVDFSNDVMAVLSKAGCNQGTCHGNRNGKGGFKRDTTIKTQDQVLQTAVNLR